MVYKPGSVECNHSSGIIITDQLKQPTLWQPDKDARLYWINQKVAVCLEFGLAFNRACHAMEFLNPCGELLPHLFTLTNAGNPTKAVCFLWRYPSGHPARTLSGIVSLKSPDFPPTLKRVSDCPTIWRKILYAFLIKLSNTKNRPKDLERFHWVSSMALYK